MPLPPRTRLGAFEILGPLAAGGMGEVYRAKDLRLGREVAIKVLPRDLTHADEVRARLEREARLISSLNHPHICTVHEVGHEGHDFYIVMELVQGETLAERLTRGALPSSDVLRLGIQIAGALAQAHRAGVVHRDLKPSNVMLSPTGAKLLDFGLARSARPPEEPGTSSRAVTRSDSLKMHGVMIGTLPYMAPEQLEAKPADARTDIWALGCVLYEMATGSRAFQGSTDASLIAAIMSADPTSITDRSPVSPAGLQKLVRGCLAKVPDDRVQAAHDVMLQLQWIAEGGPRTEREAPHGFPLRRTVPGRLGWGVAALMACAAAAIVLVDLRPAPDPKPMVFELAPPPEVRDLDLPRISPDGRRLAFNAVDSLRVSGIWVREMASREARRLSGTEGASRPFWSPDSRFLAYFAGGTLYKVDASGGLPLRVCNAPRGADGSWGARGFIVFDGGARDSIQSVPASGGPPVGVTVLDRARGQTSAAWPHFLPDGRHFLYLAAMSGREDRVLMVGSIDSEETHSLGTVSSRVEYTSGHLLHVRDGVLMAQTFDPRARKRIGEGIPIAPDVQTASNGAASFSASSEGTLVYQSGSAARERLVWVARDGRETGTLGDPGLYEDPALSPDGTHLAVARRGQTGRREIWTYALDRDVGSRATFSEADAVSPAWSPDGTRIAYTATHGGLYEIRALETGGGGEHVLLRSIERTPVNDWSPDGKWIAYLKRPEREGTWDIYALSVADSSVSYPLANMPFHEFQARYAPDGSLVAYTSMESGSREVYVQSNPKGGGKWRISSSGGFEPHWRADGREIYYRSSDGTILSVSVEPGILPRFSLPKPLFSRSDPRILSVRNRFCVSRDGSRFLIVVTDADAGGGPTTVMVDWLALAQRR